MGYDMYWESPPGNLAELNAEANRLWGEADRLHKTEPAQAKARSDQGSEIYGRYIKGAQKCGAYFRANVWGMRSLRAEMEAQGMLDLRNVAHPGGGLPPITFRAAEPVTGMPIQKFCGNEDWLVHPKEIRAALAKAKRERIVKEKDWPDAEANQFWHEWLDWLAQAAEHGGFRVR